MIYGYEISTPTDRFFWSYWSIFCTFTPLTAWKKKLSKTWKKHLKISFYTSVPKIMITGYTVPGIWHMTDVTVTFWFWAIFCLFTPLTAQKIKMKDMKKKKKKKTLEISSFYTSVPKNLIICYTVFEIWHVMDVIVVFHFG